jgi:hypothetical protein
MSSEHQKIKKHSEEHQVLRDLGFKVDTHEAISKNIQLLEAHIKEIDVSVVRKIIENIKLEEILDGDLNIVASKIINENKSPCMAHIVADRYKKDDGRVIGEYDEEKDHDEKVF